MFVWIFITMMVLDIIYCKGGVIMKHDEKDLKKGKAEEAQVNREVSQKEMEKVTGGYRAGNFTVRKPRS